MGKAALTHELEGLWPNEEQLLLLKAALLEGAASQSAWKAWRSRINIDDEFDYGSFRLLPLLYHRMQAEGVDDPLMPRLKGVFRLAWYENHRLFHEVRPFLQELAETGMDLMLVKGMPLVHLYYEHHALRPMADVDLIVREGDRDQAIRFLEDKGWKRNSLATDDDLKYRHAIQFIKGEKLELDLHWHAMPECCHADYDNLFWSRSRQVEMEGLQVHTFDPTDFLMHTVIHGVRWNEEPPIRWIADAMMILRREGDQIDWLRLVRDARTIGLAFRLHLGLNFLHQEMAAPIPAEVLKQLKSQRPTLVERIENSYVLNNSAAMFNHPLGKIWVIYAEYQRLAKKPSGWPVFKGFSHYLKHRLRLKSRAQFLPELLGGLGRRLARLVSGRA